MFTFFGFPFLAGVLNLVVWITSHDPKWWSLFAAAFLFGWALANLIRRSIIGEW